MQQRGIEFLGSDTTVRRAASEGMAHEQRRPFDDLLEALPDQAAVLDDAGTIVSVNRQWRAFAQESGVHAGRVDEGGNYIDVCRRSVAGGSLEEQFRALVRGACERLELEYAWHAGWGAKRWFLMRASRLPTGGIVVVHTDITARKSLELELLEQALHDPLTNLLNRRGLARRWPRRSPDDAGGVALVIDCDDFKQINDAHGHAVGDLVLIELARRFSAIADARDVVARIGGDEFVWVRECASREQGLALAERLRRVVDGLAIQGEAGPVRVTLSIAVAGLRERIDSLEALLLATCAALRESKRAGKNRVSGAHRGGRRR